MSTPDADISISTRLAHVRARIAAAAARAGRDSDEVTLVAVSKEVDADAVAAALAAGQRDFGENRAQELVRKADALDAQEIDGEDLAGELTWHFIGRLQRNKVRMLAARVALWQSLDRDELVDEVARRAPGARVLVEVNVAGEAQKGGCRLADVGRLVDAGRAHGLLVEGLMTVPPAGDDPRPVFAALRDEADRLALPTRSMGMSADFETAVEEGSTMVRVGTAVFGRRSGSPGL